MTRTKQTSHKMCEKISRKNLTSKANNSDKIKVKMLKKKSSKKHRIKSENMYELSAYYDLLISA